MDVLARREQLKQRYRTFTITTNNNDKPSSIFGPNTTVLPPRVVELMKGLCENPKYGVPKPKKFRAPVGGGDLVDKRKKELEKIRESRDYSFLLSDDPESSFPGKKDVSDADGSATKKLAGQSIGSKNRVTRLDSSHYRAEDKNENASRTAKGKFVKERSITKDTVVKNLLSQTKGSNKPRDLENPQKREFEDSVKRNSRTRILPQAKARKRKTGTEEDAKAIDMIRKMFKYDPNKFHDDKDDIMMQASFADIQKEERNSAKWANKEDSEELQKLIKSQRSKSRL